MNGCWLCGYSLVPQLHALQLNLFLQFSYMKLFQQNGDRHIFRRNSDVVQRTTSGRVPPLGKYDTAPPVGGSRADETKRRKTADYWPDDEPPVPAASAPGDRPAANGVPIPRLWPAQLEIPPPVRQPPAAASPKHNAATRPRTAGGSPPSTLRPSAAFARDPAFPTRYERT